MQPSHRAPALLLLLLLAAGTLHLCLASSEETTADGLTSTSLLEFAVLPHMEAMNSHERASQEPDLTPVSLHAAPGSGFASEENEESKILQPPQYFWEDGGELNDSSLDLGPTTDYNFPTPSRKAGQKGNRTREKDNWAPATVQPSAELVDPDSRTPFSSTLEEEEGLLPIEHPRGGVESFQTSGPEVTSAEPVGQEDSFSLLFSTVSARPGIVTEAATGEQEEDSVSAGLDLGSSMGPGLLPVSSVFSPTVAAGSPSDSEESFEVTAGDTWAVGGADSELTVTTTGAELAEATVEDDGEELSSREEVSEHTVGWELLKPTVLTEAEQTVETLVGTPSPAGSSLRTQTLPGSEQHHTSSASPWDRVDDAVLDPIWNDTEPATETSAAERSLAPQAGDSRMAMLPTELPWDSAQVICKDWSNLAGKNYIILNMSDNIDCEEFRLEKGPQLLALVEDAFSRQADGLQDRWLISLSKPNENDKHLLMTLAGEQGVIPTKDVLMALGDVKRSLAEIGIQNYSTTTSCQSHPNQTRSDYGKLFVVLVIIGSICAIIIVLGLIYNCWQRRLPKMKNMSHGEELRFVENGCHDNPTLDVASDSQSEMQEKKPSVNGGNTINGPESWDVLINKQASEDVDVFEEDTHL
ncbi:podocalyxin-like protein 2 [Neopsephotus bourkii]|uniref:podocalyxin-like protein 2 n=1 Tax=Neopsephotus bourkii TaxID=309878 RepID=UPI002AA5276B|nr:podocalyxin-like protein 2 [Neopsephotus bourkii]